MDNNTLLVVGSVEAINNVLQCINPNFPPQNLENLEKNDCYYVDHVSLGFDLKILAKTITSVVGRKNIFVNNKTAAEGGLHIEPAPQGKSSKKQTEITK